MKTTVSAVLMAGALLANCAMAHGQYPAAQQGISRVRTTTGIVRRVSDRRIVITRQHSQNLRVTISFSITDRTVIEGSLSVGATVRVDYTTKVSVSRHNGRTVSINRNRALLIRVAPPASVRQL